MIMQELYVKQRRGLQVMFNTTNADTFFEEIKG